jgi:lysophospholipase L1-like esterase
VTRARPWAALCTAVVLVVAACDGVSEPFADAPPAPGASVRVLAAGGDRHFASFSHTCAVLGGGVQCWGAGESGQLGDGVLAWRSPHPVEVVAPGGGATAVAAGGVHSCAVVNAEALCWGANDWAQVGSQRPYVAVAPRRVGGLPGPVVHIAAGSRHTCASVGASVWCWGRNDAGQAGAPKCTGPQALMKCKAAPARVVGLDGAIGALALGRRHSCALMGGVVHCWGENDRGQLGDGTAASRSTPAPVRGISGEATQLAAGEDHTCALAGGRVMCWGANGRGQLGDGTSLDRREAVASAGLPAEVTALAAGRRHTCAATSRGVHCWGDGREGQLDGVPRPSPRPVDVPGLAGDVTALAAGVDHTCAARTAGRVACWGDNDFGQLGSGDAPADHAAPVGTFPWDDGTIRDRDGDGRITVACLGDSNTERMPSMPPPWCERVAELAPAVGWKLVNRGEAGATAVGFRSLILADEHLDYALENDGVDAVILAYGTNDLLIARSPPEEVALAYERLRRRARTAGVEVFVALTPPVQPPIRDINADVGELNAVIAKLFPASRIIDFWSGMSPEDFTDGVHFEASGHAKRALAAWKVLSAAADPSEAP